jgi:hypothetical protein
VDHAVLGLIGDNGARRGDGRERLRSGRGGRNGDWGGYRGDQHGGLGFRRHLGGWSDGLRRRGRCRRGLGFRFGDRRGLDRSGYLGDDRDDRSRRGNRFGLVVGVAGLLGGRLLVCLGLFGLYVASQPLALGLAAGAVGLRLLDARRMTLYADTERDAQIECFLVGQPELFG